LDWSPEQIAGWLKRTHPEDECANLEKESNHWHDRCSVFTLEGSKRIQVGVTLGQRAEQRMKLAGCMVTLSMMCLSMPVAVAQSGMPAPTNDVRLGNIMNSVQLRHLKLWAAVKALNWELAAYELRQLTAGVVEAAVLYPGIPVTNVTTMEHPLQAIADAIEAKDSRRFAKSFGELTDGCNACHQSMGRGYIVMRAPTEQPFSNQRFSPQAKP
jgi:hypothetical protein